MSQDNDKIKNPNNTLPNSENKIKVNKSNSEIALKVPTNDANNLVNTGQIQFRIRNDMVAKATEFLLTHIQNSTMTKKIEFLRNKGLNDPEIELAIQTAMAHGQNQHAYPPPQPVYFNASNAVQAQLETQNWFRKLFGPNYVQKWLFGMQKSSIENRLEAVEVAIHRCLILLEQQNNMSEFSYAKASQQNELEKIRAEVKSIKSLLLNKSQFPPAPATSDIPEWQLPKNAKPQVDQQNKVIVNGTDTPNKSLLNMFNEQNSSPSVVHSSSNGPFAIVGSHTTGIVNGDIVDKNSTLTYDSKSNGTVLPASFDDDAIRSEVALVDDDQSNNIEHSL